MQIKTYIFLIVTLFRTLSLSAQTPENKISESEEDRTRWFKQAKFGLFIHWGLYSELAGTWKGRRFYGSGEWIMNQGKIPVSEYSTVADRFNPENFDAALWARFAQDAGFKYLVITAKHHEGFSMFDSKVSDFNIVKASPYGKDPMVALSNEVRKRGIHFGFYYSQFLDWHEANGGGNDWDFIEKEKNYKLYYKHKSVPQLKELLTRYGPLGIVWFDMAGGLNAQETDSMIQDLRSLQPNALFSSRVGHGLGDYLDFGDSEIPPDPIPGAWEAIYTHNDSWGYMSHDQNFKSSKEIIVLLAKIASKGGNLMINVGPDGKGNLPEYSIKYLLETGKWLKKNGSSIYGTSSGFIPEQPWGVTTSKPGKLFLHVFTIPKNNRLLIPDLSVKIKKIYRLEDQSKMEWTYQKNQLSVTIPKSAEENSGVYVVEYTGAPDRYNQHAPVPISQQFESIRIDPTRAKLYGESKKETVTYPHYFGDWKHVNCINNMKTAADSAVIHTQVIEPGDYRISLEYACSKENSNQEGELSLSGTNLMFRTLATTEFNQGQPVLFIKHSIGVATLTKQGRFKIVLKPTKASEELFKLKSIIIEPMEK